MAKIANIYINNSFFEINTHYLFWDAVFAEKKTPEGTAPASTRGLEASNHLVWRHPITLRSLVVWSTDVGPKISNNKFNKFLTFLKVAWDHLGCVWGVVRGPQEQLWSEICLKK